MNESVKNYIYGTEEEKLAFLFKVGLYEKIYAPDGSNPDPSEYPFVDESSNEKKRYKKVALPVTEEEYKEIQKAYQMKKQLGENTSTEETQDNKTATAFSVICTLIFLAGFILGFVFGNQKDPVYNHDEFVFTTALITWVSFFLAGMVFIGIGEIISQLHNINEKL